MFQKTRTKRLNCARCTHSVTIARVCTMLACASVCSVHTAKPMGAYYCYYCPLNIILSVCITLQNAYQWLAGRSVYSEELIAFYALCEECFREKMYHDPLNTQIMIAIERFHLFSPAAKQKLKHQQHRRCEQPTNKSVTRATAAAANSNSVTINIVLQLQSYDQIMIIRACVCKELRKYQKVNHSKSQHNAHFPNRYTHTHTPICGQSQACTFRMPCSCIGITLIGYTLHVHNCTCTQS